jgi:hypothetical protein
VTTAIESEVPSQEVQGYESQGLHIQVVFANIPSLPGNCHHWLVDDPSKENLTSFY